MTIGNTWTPYASASPASSVPSRAQLSAITIPLVLNGLLVFCSEASFQGFYFFSLDSGAPIDGVDVLATSRGGASRWILFGGNLVGNAADCFDVRTYGAKMDGITPLGPAVQLAIGAAAANGGGKICIPYDSRFPNSFYDWGSTPVTFNYAPNTFAANLVFQGGGASAPIRIPGTFPVGSNVINIDNPISLVSFFDLIFFPETQKLANFSSLIAANSGELLYLERCEVLGLSGSGGVINSNIAAMRLKNVFLRGCFSELSGVITINNLSRGVFFDGVKIIDIGTLGTPGGPRGTWNIFGDSLAGILISPNGGALSSGDSCGIYMRDVFVDERNKKNIKIDAGASARIPWVYLDGIHCNTLTSTLVEGCDIEITKAETVEIKRSLAIYSSRPLTPAIKLSDVVQCDVYAERTGGAPGDNNGAGVNRIIADNLCGSLTLRECDFTLIDSQAKTTTIIKNGETRTISRNNPTTTEVIEERETRATLTAIVGGGGTTVVKESVEDGANTFIEETRVSANATEGVFEQGAKAALGLTAGQATFPPATTGTNPTNTAPNDVASAAFGATGAVWTAGAGADRQNALLTVTNQLATPVDFFVRSKVKKHWGKFEPSQWARLWGDILIGLWLPSGIVNSAGVVGTWKDFSGKGNDLIAAGALRPNFLAASGPNGLPACQFTGTQRLTCHLATAFRQGTMLAVGTNSATDQTYMALSNAAGAWSAEGVRLATRTTGGTVDVVCEIQDFPPGARITDDPAHAYHTQTGTFWASQQNVYTELLRGTFSPGGLGVDALSEICVGALQGGGNPLTGEIQALGLLNQALPPDYTLDAGRLIFEYINFYKGLCGT